MSALRKTTKSCISRLMKTSRWFAVLCVLSVVGLLCVGCKSEDELSTRPWSTPKSWESGLPAGLTEGR